MPVEPFIAVTDTRWFEFLSSRATEGRIDEANFWSPKAAKPMRHFRPGEPVFLRLKRPHNVVVGYGFFAHFAELGLREAWQFFEWRNGDPDEVSFRRRIGDYRGVDLSDARTESGALGCTILRDLNLWPEGRWLPWGDAEDWKPNTQRGATVRDPLHASRLLAEIQFDGLQSPEDLADGFEPIEADERTVVEARVVRREGQGTFKSRLLDAYGRRCAITGERTEPVLDAAHIQPYLGPRSNHPQNGLLLTQEFHTLFDRGFVTVTPELVVRVSPRLQESWGNGKRYYEFDDKPLRSRPESAVLRPSAAALAWHAAHVFRR